MSSLWYFPVFISVITQDQSAYAQMELLKEEQERKLNQNHMDYEKKINKVKQNFLQQIESLKGLIQVRTWDLRLII